MATAELRVLDLRCAACADHVEDDLRAASGVSEASVDYSRDLAKVTYEPQQINEERIRELIAERGYRCAMGGDGATAAPRRSADQLGHDAQLAPICCGTKRTGCSTSCRTPRPSTTTTRSRRATPTSTRAWTTTCPTPRSPGRWSTTCDAASSSRWCSPSRSSRSRP